MQVGVGTVGSRANVLCLRRGATADFSPAFQGRDQIADWSRRVATIEKPLVSGVATRRKRSRRLIPALKGQAKVSRRSATKGTTHLSHTEVYRSVETLAFRDARR
jgi:hypothetical protein